MSSNSDLVFVPDRQSIMKRDLDLIREILLSVESWNDSRPLTLGSLTYEEKTKQEIGYQLELLEDVGPIRIRYLSLNSCGSAKFHVTWTARSLRRAVVSTHAQSPRGIGQHDRRSLSNPQVSLFPQDCASEPVR